MATDRIYQETLEVVKSANTGGVNIYQESLEVIKALNNSPVLMYQEVLEVVKALGINEISISVEDTLTLSDSILVGGELNLTGPGTGYVFEIEKGVGRLATYQE